MNIDLRQLRGARTDIGSQLDEREHLYKVAQFNKADDITLARDEGWIECAHFVVEQLDARIKKAAA